MTDRNTHAEDLAEPVAERELAQLTKHRDRLAAFMQDRNLKIDQLITVSKELAAVQSRLDELNTRHGNLRRRLFWRWTGRWLARREQRDR